jgi:hypothetical protein
MFILVAFFVIVLMLNLLIAIMGDSYEKVKEAETVEGLLGKAKMIVNAELLHDTGSFIMMASNRNHYPAYMHIVEAVDDDEGPGTMHCDPACKHLIVSIPTAPLIPPPAADDALPPLSHPCACATCRSTRLRRGSAVRSSPPVARCLGVAARRPRGGDGGDEWRRGGRLFEAVEIIDSKMTKDARGGILVVLATFLLLQPHQMDTADPWFECLLLRQAGDVPESRRHRLAVQVELGVFSEVCGHFYVAAGR